MYRFVVSTMVLATVLFSPRLHAQAPAVPARVLNIYGYALASGARPELTYGPTYGGAGGLIVEHTQWIGFDARGIAIRANSPIHIYTGEFGPRIEPRIGRIQPYAEILAGLGHSGYLRPGHHVDSGYGTVWTAVVGTDLRLTNRIEWRVFDYSFSTIYASPFGGRGASPTIISTGLVIRFH